MFRFAIVVAATACLVPSPLVAPGAAQGEDAASDADLAKIADGLLANFARVEITLQYDKGQGPGGNDWRSYALGAMAQDGDPHAAPAWESFIQEERPAEVAGVLLAPTKVMIRDPGLHPRFVRSIAVRFGQTLIPAKVAAYARTHDAVVLELARPAPTTAKSVAFAGETTGPLLVASYRLGDASWGVSLARFSTSVALTEDGRRFARAPNGLVVDAKGAAVGFVTERQVPADDSWKVSPESWEWIGAADYSRMLESVGQAASSAIRRVTVNFRSPRNQVMGGFEGYPPDYGVTGGANDPDMTEWNGTGVVVDERTVLILANLNPKVTARLERIRVADAQGNEHTAEFAGSLEDWGGFLATLRDPVSAPAWSTRPVTDSRGRMLMKALVAVQGQTRTDHYLHDRATDFVLGWQRNVFPMLEAADLAYSPWDDSGSPELSFYFDDSGALVAIPIAQRQKVAVRDEYAGPFDGLNSYAAPAPLIRAAVGSIDPENRPLSEAEESRLAWLGVEMQAMDPDLARESGVIEETRNGTTGVLVSYIYPGSPAEKAGLQIGDIILRLHIEGQPKPLDAQLDDYGLGGMFDQLWEMMDQMPEEFFDQLPSPWGSAENAITRALTDVGFGTKFTADVFRDGEVASLPFIVEQGPPHYEGAARSKSEEGGLTVRDLTYEVRRFFQLAPEDPGVIVSKIESGEPAAVAGVRPYEIITSVNDEPVRSAEEFRAAIAPGGEFRLNIKRMTEGRIVKVRIAAAAD